MVSDKQRVTKHPWKEIYEVIGEDYFKQSYVVFPKYFISKFKKHYNEPQFIYVEFKKDIQHVDLEHTSPPQIVNIKQKFIEELYQS